MKKTKGTCRLKTFRGFGNLLFSTSLVFSLFSCGKSEKEKRLAAENEELTDELIVCKGKLMKLENQSTSSTNKNVGKDLIYQVRNFVDVIRNVSAEVNRFYVANEFLRLSFLFSSDQTASNRANIQNMLPSIRLSGNRLIAVFDDGSFIVLIKDITTSDGWKLYLKYCCALENFGIHSLKFEIVKTGQVFCYSFLTICNEILHNNLLNRSVKKITLFSDFEIGKMNDSSMHFTVKDYSNCSRVFLVEGLEGIKILNILKSWGFEENGANNDGKSPYTWKKFGFDKNNNLVAKFLFDNYKTPGLLTSDDISVPFCDVAPSFCCECKLLSMETEVNCVRFSFLPNGDNFKEVVSKWKNKNGSKNENGIFCIEFKNQNEVSLIKETVRFCFLLQNSGMIFDKISFPDFSFSSSGFKVGNVSVDIVKNGQFDDDACNSCLLSLRLINFIDKNKLPKDLVIEIKKEGLFIGSVVVPFPEINDNVVGLIRNLKHFGCLSRIYGDPKMKFYINFADNGKNKYILIIGDKVFDIKEKQELKLSQEKIQNLAMPKKNMTKKTTADS